MKKQALVALSTILISAAAAALTASAEPTTRFVSEGAYAPVDADGLWDRINASLPSRDPGATFLPAAGLGPVAVALQALEASEPALGRVRYRVRQGTDWGQSSAGGAWPLSYVEVVRFNLGPALRQGLIDSLGTDAVAAAEEFGLGPHVGWRIVTRPVMGNRAIVVAAGRMELGEQEAADESCFGSPCVAAAPLIDGVVAWSDMAADPAGATGITADISLPLAVAGLLLGESDSIESQAEPGAPAVPAWAIEAVVEVNLGQDEGVDAAYRQGGLMDDSVAALWQRLAIFGTGPEPAAFRANAYECRRGGGFAPPGGLCP